MASSEATTKRRRLNDSSIAKDATKKEKLPITLLCGFLGAGKTTLLQHILHTKHANENESFKCAIIVNDMAELNIDKSLIDESALIQTDELISMQNGCICCDLQSDLIKQIVDLAKKDTFDYMIIEASGVSEPSEVASLFAECQEDHDHETQHNTKETQLKDLARLDTCVTVLDCNEFINHFERINHSKQEGETAKLLAEQIEFSNVTILNKTDLVSSSQLDQIKYRVQLLNPRAKVLISSRYSPLENIMDVVDTKLFHEDDFHFINREEFVLKEATDATTKKSCCVESEKAGETPCCESKPKENSAKSQIILPSAGKTRHEKRFGISSFLYTSRLPFHPIRFHKEFLDKYFVILDNEEEEEDEDGEHDHHNETGEHGGGEESENKGNVAVEEEKKEEDDPKVEERKVNEEEEEEEERIMDMQVDAVAKQKIRKDAFDGMLLRSKGFVWLPNMHDFKVTYSQAGSMVTMENSLGWTVLQADAYGADEEKKKELRKNWEGPYGDRRQEIVFIGIDLKPRKIQSLLDKCIMTPEEYDLGIDGWKATIGDIFHDS